MHLRLGQEFVEQPGKADRFAGQFGADHGVAGGGRVAFVEDEVDRLKHRREALRQGVPVGNLVGDCVIADALLGADDALGDGRRGREEGAGDLLGREAADLAEGHRDLRVLGQGGMAAGEDQAQGVVGDRLHFSLGFGHFILDLPRDLGGCLVEPDAAAHPVDGPEAAGRDQPGARVPRYALLGPLHGGRGERVVQSLLGQLETAEQPDEGCEHTAAFGPVDGIEVGYFCTPLT